MKNKNKLIKYFKNNNIKYEINKNIKELFSIKIGGKCAIYTEISDEKDFKVINYLIKNKIKYYLIANGSNIIFKGKKYNGLIIKINKNYNKKILIDNLLIVESGASLTSLNNYCRDNNLSGLEFSFGIPGSVGGATFMNAGAYGGEIKNVVEFVKIFDGNDFKILQNADCFFEYRNSIFKQNKMLAIVAVGFRLNKSSYDIINSQMQENMNKRLNSQPYDKLSAGSVFKRIDNIIVSKAFDLMKLKGYHINDIQVSTKHAGFIINNGKGTYKDFDKLVKHLKTRFYCEYKKKLELEVCILE